jgi:hypothetical protein
MSKKRRTYLPRIVGDKVMMPADLQRLHKYMLDIEHIDHISDEMRAVVESEWPELAHKLPNGKDHSPVDNGRVRGLHKCQTPRSNALSQSSIFQPCFGSD